MGLKKIRIVPVRRKSELGGEHAFGIQVLGPGGPGQSSLNTMPMNEMFKVFPSASVLFILIGLECLWTLPGGSAGAERSAPSCPGWIVGHSLDVLSAGGSSERC